jgi:hypothetical protein
MGDCELAVAPVQCGDSNAIGSTIEGWPFSGLFTHVKIDHIGIRSAGKVASVLPNARDAERGSSMPDRRLFESRNRPRRSDRAPAKALKRPHLISTDDCAASKNEPSGSNVGMNPAHTSSPTCIMRLPANGERARICGSRQHGRTATWKALARRLCCFATSTLSVAPARAASVPPSPTA